jgi:hypothetical protein
MHEKSGTSLPAPLFKTLSVSAPQLLLVLGVELGFALFAAESDGFAVFAFAGDAGVSRLAADGACVGGHGDGSEGEGADGEQCFHRGVLGMGMIPVKTPGKARNV